LQRPIRGFYRITPPALDGKASDTKVEKLSIDFGHCQGLLYAFGALYGVVNDATYSASGTPGKGGADVRGLYRLTDTDKDDQFDKIEALKIFPGKAGGAWPARLGSSPMASPSTWSVGTKRPCRRSIIA